LFASGYLQEEPSKPQAMAHIAELKKQRLQDYGFHLEYRTRWLVIEDYSYNAIIPDRAFM
jgi:hypothetical protein